MEFEAVIGLEVHAELATQSKMFCACPVVDLTRAAPNTAVCPVCAGMPGSLPVVNEKAVEYGIRVGIACRPDPVLSAIRPVREDPKAQKLRAFLTMGPVLTRRPR